MTIVSCKKKDDNPMNPQVETNGEPTTSITPGSEEVKDSTSIKVGTNGVNISTKDGATKTDVNVSGGEAKIEIKK
ncbi:hypothetical protein [Flavobacterium sp. 83]|uniref:hypothetical protein n=1 Tax=Flavobacterium sp. 83 TaxID=1131812 RepID=UPI000AA3E84E|nr:hypothetical protein [Flavobacterium sp. 83]